MKENANEFYRVKTVANMLDCSKGHVWGLLRKGIFTRVKLSEQITVVPADEVNSFIRDLTPKAA